ncbi:uncharacterized protein YbbK (DUF523 family) [Thiogranum longum]|uniref:Uncharacterized protein YbbK (DUF523 family) n=1 Tax=Thiogranum longum TaxID=1537524 RepID=A0A4R1HBI1_9GAMM|nr:DUF523 domain-containing protein [Thiogranum longum]TCK17961.1 uncharacterized protein YbbK (DUF523 family) [Thiogranum longum]
MEQPNRPRVAVSSCLLGEPVRYDGGHKRSDCVTDLLSTCFDWFPVCPEVAIGLGVPRPPIQLVKLHDGVHALGADNPSLDVTAALQACAQQLAVQLADANGYIFKSRSPSCGLTDADLFNSEGYVTGQAPGIFAATIQACLPDLPLIDEILLDDPVAREAFIQQVKVYRPAGEELK